MKQSSQCCADIGVLVVVFMLVLAVQWPNPPLRRLSSIMPKELSALPGGRLCISSYAERALEFTAPGSCCHALRRALAATAELPKQA